MYIGKKKGGGPWYVLSADCQREFPEIKSKHEMYGMLRMECGFPKEMSNFEVYQQAMLDWEITPEGFRPNKPR